MSDVTIRVRLFRAGARRAAGQMTVSSADPHFLFYSFSWGLDGRSSLSRTASLICDIYEDQRYCIEVFRLGKNDRVAKLSGVVSRKGFVLEEGVEGCQVTIENEILPGVYYEGRAFADPMQPCICCGYVEASLNWPTGCVCNLAYRCSSCYKCQEHCTCSHPVQASGDVQPSISG